MVKKIQNVYNLTTFYEKNKNAIAGGSNEPFSNCFINNLHDVGKRD